MNAQQLRNSILQEAIEGRLVPQDPNDEPASVLLERIREEKRRLVKEGKLKKKDLEETPISEDEKPFEIPESWEWVRVSQIMSVKGGKRVPLGSSWTTTPTKHIYIRVTDMKNGSITNKDLRYITDDVFEKIKSYTISKNDLYVTVAGTIGAVGIVPEDFDGMNLTENADKLTDITINKDYIVKCFNSPYVQECFKSLTNQMAQPKLSIRNILTLMFPLPPLAEQHRIVAKIEELMPKVEEYGKAQEALDKLNAELPEKLKKSILQEAIEGRLVPQDPNDEPASVLLERIREEKRRLVKEGKLKKKDLVSEPITDEEKPFEIPESWEWCRVCDISESFIGLTYKPSDVSEIGWIVLRSSNIQNGQLDYNDIVKVNIDVPEKLHVKQNDIIICARNGSKKLVGKSAIVRNVDVPTTFGAFMAICRTDFYEYMAKYLLSPLFFTQLRKESDTTTINQLTQKNFNKYLVPLPPLAEQKRIVAKIEELFAEIDKLKTK